MFKCECYVLKKTTKQNKKTVFFVLNSYKKKSESRFLIKSQEGMVKREKKYFHPGNHIYSQKDRINN